MIKIDFRGVCAFRVDYGISTTHLSLKSSLLSQFSIILYFLLFKRYFFFENCGDGQFIVQVAWSIRFVEIDYDDDLHMTYICLLICVIICILKQEFINVGICQAWLSWWTASKLSIYVKVLIEWSFYLLQFRSIRALVGFNINIICWYR